MTEKEKIEEIKQILLKEIKEEIKKEFEEKKEKERPLTPPWYEKIGRWIKERLLGWTGLGIGFFLIFFTLFLNSFLKVISSGPWLKWGWIGIGFILILIWLNAWKDSEGGKKLVAIVGMLLIGVVLVAIMTKFWAVDFRGIPFEQLITHPLVWIIVVSFATLSIFPGTGKYLFWTLILVCVFYIGYSLYGLSQGWSPVPLEKKIALEIKREALKKELQVCLKEIEGIKKKIENSDNSQLLDDLLIELKKQEDKCTKIRQKYIGIKPQISIEQKKFKMLMEKEKTIFYKEVKQKIIKGTDDGVEVWWWIGSGQKVIQFEGTLEGRKVKGYWTEWRRGTPRTWYRTNWGEFEVRFDPEFRLGTGWWRKFDGVKRKKLILKEEI